jgi:hypothetical protein
MTAQLSRYKARKKKEEWLRKKKNHYETFTVLLDGLTLAIGFWFLMALVKEEEALLLGFLLLALATTALWAQTTKDIANSFFATDTPKMVMPKVIDFIEALRYSKSEGISSERRKK